MTLELAEVSRENEYEKGLENELILIPYKKMKHSTG